MSSFFTRVVDALRRRRPTPSLTAALVSAVHPEIAAALRAEGALTERTRIRGVYEAASLDSLTPLVERLMFDGATQPETAALASVLHEQTRMKIVAQGEEQCRRISVPETNAHVH